MGLDVFRFSVLASVLISSVGCSGPAVEGTVKVNDVDVSAGQVRFEPQDDGEEFSAIIRNGKFSVKKKDIAGEYKVIINVSFVESGDAAEFYSNIDGGREPEEEGESEHPQSHEFQATLKNGRNVLDYNIEK